MQRNTYPFKDTYQLPWKICRVFVEVYNDSFTTCKPCKYIISHWFLVFSWNICSLQKKKWWKLRTRKNSLYSSKNLLNESKNTLVYSTTLTNYHGLYFVLICLILFFWKENCVSSDNASFRTWNPDILLPVDSLFLLKIVPRETKTSRIEKRPCVWKASTYNMINLQPADNPRVSSIDIQ